MTPLETIVLVINAGLLAANLWAITRKIPVAREYKTSLIVEAKLSMEL